MASQHLTEYVYAPDGSPLGSLHHQQETDLLAAGQSRIMLSSKANEELAGTSLAAVAGERTFSLNESETVVQHTGPDSIGITLKWGTIAQTGRCFWPRFGLNVATLTFTPETSRHLSISHYAVATRPVATSITVAGINGGWPELNGPRWGGYVADVWRGTLSTFAPDGTLQNQQPVTRRYHGLRWEDALADNGTRHFDTEIELWAPAPIASGSITGAGRHAGWLLEIEGVDGPGKRLELSEVLDGPGGQLCGLRRWWHTGQLHHIEVIHLTPDPEETP